MKYFYGKFMSLFPLGLGVAIVWVGRGSSPTLSLLPGLEVSREVVIGIGAAFIVLAFVMMVFARYVELAMFKSINLVLPEPLRIELESPVHEDKQLQETLPEERRILKKGVCFELDSNYVLTSHIFTIREGLIGVLCLLLVAGYVAASWTTSRFPDVGFLPLILFLAGIVLFSKRTDILIDANAGVLTERRKVIGVSQVQNQNLDNFDRIIIKKRNWFGLSIPAQTGGPGNAGFSVIYLVQLGGTGLFTINFYRQYENARELALALVEVTHLPLLEIL